MNINYEKEFSSITTPGAYKLVDPKHPFEFYLGIDDKGHKSIVIRGNNKPAFLKSTSAIEVLVGKTRNNCWQLSFHLLYDSMAGLFYRFCDDLIETSRKLPSDFDGLEFTAKRYNSWKKLFYIIKKDLLSENEIIGLIGELLFMKTELANIYGYEVAVKSWTGCDKTHKDFSIDDEWFEIKSTFPTSLTVKISSIEQLDSDNDGHLIVYEFEKMSEVFEGMTLNSIVRDILSSFPFELEDLILAKLKNSGYCYDDYYDKFVYRLYSYNKYIVSETFPRIRKDYISDSIVKVQYEILKRDLDKYLEE